VNVIDDRFVSPLEDLSHQYQSYELEETTRILSVHGNKQEQIAFGYSPSYAIDFSDKEITFLPNLQNEFFFSSLSLYFFLLSLPPPSLV